MPLAARRRAPPSPVGFYDILGVRTETVNGRIVRRVMETLRRMEDEGWSVCITRRIRKMLLWPSPTFNGRPELLR